MILRPIHTSDALYPQVEALWLDAFPHCERRPTPDQRHNVDQCKAFHCLVAEEDGQFVGFFTYWQFQTSSTTPENSSVSSAATIRCANVDVCDNNPSPTPAIANANAIAPSSFCYGEHFAVHPDFRNRGMGAEILRALLSYIGNQPLVLEVEMPNDPIAIRRIAFYRRQGFVLWEDCHYEQPPYHPEDAPLPMFIMAYGSISPAAFPLVRSIIHREVYHYPQS